MADHDTDHDAAHDTGHDTDHDAGHDTDHEHAAHPDACADGADIAGVPTDEHCRGVLDEVWLYLDGEISPEERRTIKGHLDDCGPCLRRFGIEQEVKALVARCCGQEQTPSHLRERVLTTLRSVVVSSDARSVSITSTTVTTSVTGTALADDDRLI